LSGVCQRLAKVLFAFCNALSGLAASLPQIRRRPAAACRQVVGNLFSPWIASLKHRLGKMSDRIIGCGEPFLPLDTGGWSALLQQPSDSVPP
jgi:hypothetical protein